MSVVFEQGALDRMYVIKCVGRLLRTQVAAVTETIADLSERGQLEAAIIDARKIVLDDSPSLGREMWEDSLTALPDHVSMAYITSPDFADRREAMVRELIRESEKRVAIFADFDEAQTWVGAQLSMSVPA